MEKSANEASRYFSITHHTFSHHNGFMEPANWCLVLHGNIFRIIGSLGGGLVDSTYQLFTVRWNKLLNKQVMWITMMTAGPFKWLLGACPSISWAVAGLRNTLRFQCNLRQISKYKVFQVCKRRHFVWALVWLSRHTKRICKETETDKERERVRENEIKGERSGWFIKPQWIHDISCQTERFNNRTKKHQFPFTGTKWTILIGTSSRPCGWIFTCEWYFPFERSD